MEKNKKIRWIVKSILFFVFISCSLLFVGCEGGVSGVVLYSKAKDMINPVFFDNNRVCGAHYKNPDYVEGESPYYTKYIRDMESPSNRTFIVSDEESFSEIFVEGALDVDFTKETVVVYFFCDVSPREYYIKKIDRSESNIVITVKLKEPAGVSCGEAYGDAVAPYQRAFVFVIKKVNVSAVEIKKI